MKLVSLKTVNYRTLDDLSLSLDPSFSAICGPNDAGKTNVFRALRCILKYEAPYFQFSEQVDLSEKQDWPKWKIDKQPSDFISIAAELAIESQRDAGLYQFILRQLQLSNAPATLNVTIKLGQTIGHEDKQRTVRILDKDYRGLAADEVFNRIHSSRALLVHNSTEAISAFPFSRRIGRVKELFADKEEVGKLEDSIMKGLRKIARTRQNEIEELLGRLGKKFRVSLTLPALDVDEAPFDLALGHSNSSVPLDDWGSGTRNRTMILLLLFAARKMQQAKASAEKVSPIVIIEEPECFLHPSAQSEFSHVLQELALEFDVQVLVSTHSPYMLSIRRPESNVLLERKVLYGAPRGTMRTPTDGDAWMAPFAQALGMNAELFQPWKELFLSGGECLLLVEGELDRQYLELLRDAAHGTGQLRFAGKIVPYEGTGQLNNTVLLRLLQGHNKRLLITYDLDAEDQIEPQLVKANFVRGTHYHPIGVDAPGRRCIEGLLPEAIRNGVRSANPVLVDALESDKKDEREKAKRELKHHYLGAFKAQAKPGDENYKDFYKLARVLNAAMQSSIVT